MIRNPWKGIFVLLAILAPAVAGRCFAQESKGSPDGLYAVPDVGEGEIASAAQDSSSQRSAQSYLSSLDSQGEQFKRDLEKAEAARQAAASAKRLRYLAAGGDSHWPAWRPSLSERAWIAIMAGVGLVVSLAAGGYVWWARTQYAMADGAGLLALNRERAANPDGGAESQTGFPNVAPQDVSPNNYVFANHLRKNMNIFKRLSDLTGTDLRQLQTAILGEIQRRKELSGIATANGSVIDTQNPGEGEHSTTMSKPAPDTARPLPPRRAA